MTTTQTDYGPIHHGGPCKDDYENIILYSQPGQGTPVKLQLAAMRSFKDCERRYARLTRPYWTKKRKEQGRLIRLTGSWRSCAYQSQLYASDRNRYANPDTTLHCRALAIDVWNPVPATVKRILLAHGWKQSRPVDEPWHFSFELKA